MAATGALSRLAEDTKQSGFSGGTVRLLLCPGDPLVHAFKRCVFGLRLLDTSKSISNFDFYFDFHLTEGGKTFANVTSGQTHRDRDLEECVRPFPRTDLREVAASVEMGHYVYRGVKLCFTVPSV